MLTDVWYWLAVYTYHCIAKCRMDSICVFLLHQSLWLRLVACSNPKILPKLWICLDIWQDSLDFWSVQHKAAQQDNTTFYYKDVDTHPWIQWEHLCALLNLAGLVDDVTYKGSGTCGEASVLCVQYNIKNNNPRFMYVLRMLQRNNTKLSVMPL
jgi:hypothetical protein